jgi:hypothetical protein
MFERGFVFERMVKYGSCRQYRRPATRARTSGFFDGRTGGAVDGFADALIGAAAADIAAHEVVDIGVGGFWFLGEQRDCGHDLAGLAIAALRDVFCDPGLLDGVGAVGGEAFDGGDFFAADGGDLSDTGAGGFAVDVHGAGAAKGHAAAEFCAGHVEGVAEHPEKGHVGADVDGLGFSVQSESDGHGVLLRQGNIVQQAGID